MAKERHRRNRAPLQTVVIDKHRSHINGDRHIRRFGKLRDISFERLCARLGFAVSSSQSTADA